MKARSKFRRKGEASPGFQIAPMIDVVFVIMLYFMVMAGNVQKEKANLVYLPGPPNENALESPDEISIRVDDDGQVSLNDDLLDSSGSTALPELAAELKLLKGTGDRSNTKLFVTIDAAETAHYQRVMDVLDAVSLANITNVTFRSVE